jgi:hypothetical protein
MTMCVCVCVGGGGVRAFCKNLFGEKFMLIDSSFIFHVKHKIFYRNFRLFVGMKNLVCLVFELSLLLLL